MRAVCVVLITVSLLFVTAASWAAVYDVENIDVDVTAKTASQARELALVQGYRQAYEKLLARLVPREQLSVVTDITDTQLQGLVERFQVYEEKNSDTRYLATLKIVFQPERVRNYLRSNYVKFSETSAKPTLVLPIYSSTGAKLLWESPNPWREAWGAAALTDGLVPFVLPTGDMTDYSLISANHAAAADDYRLAAIAERYQVDQVLIAEAEESIDFRTGGTQLEARADLVSLNTGERRKIEFDRSKLKQGDDQFASLAKTITVAIEEDWKARTVLDFSKRQILNARVPLRSLKTWLAVQTELEKVSLIERVGLTSLSIESAQIDIQFLGTLNQLKVALNQKNLLLEAEDSFWELRFSGL